jgi:DNA-binding transcriptional regulator YiaG
MTPLQIKHIRRSYGMSANTFASLTGVASGRTVRRWQHHRLENRLSPAGRR